MGRYQSLRQNSKLALSRIGPIRLPSANRVDISFRRRSDPLNLLCLFTFTFTCFLTSNVNANILHRFYYCSSTPVFHRSRRHVHNQFSFPFTTLYFPRTRFRKASHVFSLFFFSHHRITIAFHIHTSSNWTERHDALSAHVSTSYRPVSYYATPEPKVGDRGILVSELFYSLKLP